MGDLIWPRLFLNAWLAVSGADGELLWARTLPDRNVVGQPAVADVDGDGGVDLILTSGGYKETSTNPRIREYWVDAVSGRTAESLWRYTIDSQHCPRAAVVSEFDAKQLVVLTAGKTLITIEAATRSRKRFGNGNSQT